MGYDSRIYVVEKSQQKNENGKRWGQVIARYEMCKFSAFGGIFKTESDCYIYADDGNTEIIEDCYGETLKEADILEVIHYLENYKNIEEYYRRVDPLLGLLKGFNTSNWGNLTVLHYGH